MERTDIAERIEAIRATLPADGSVGLVAVSKFHPAEAVREAYEAGQRVFGESRVQELAVKTAALPADIRWHFIGHLQTNKVRRLLELRPALIESIDSERLLQTVDDMAQRVGCGCVRVLMQLHVAREETKFGFSPDELLEYFASRRFESLKAVHICGVMGMASNTDDEARVREDFRMVRSTFDRIRELCPDLRGFDTVSMGMSHDYLLAMAEGSTLVRVGTAIFGDRS
ncbi:MAG: YggS family pyridoxal phosphate-dependent enzyme [Muribaculaceae bacterium]|nr:YggS family pyridoxal phosphate-dependent enzyme [Muribaculaceae bacterium]